MSTFSTISVVAGMAGAAAIAVFVLYFLVYLGKPWQKDIDAAVAGGGAGDADINVVNGALVWNSRTLALLPQNPPPNASLAIINGAGELDATTIGTTVYSLAHIDAPTYLANM